MNKLTKKWQMTLYATSGMGVNMLNLMFTSYLCSALLVGGFGEAVLPFQTELCLLCLIICFLPFIIRARH